MGDHHSTRLCKSCSLPIGPGSEAFELSGDAYHSKCFKCSKCENQLDQRSHFLVLGTGDLVCSECSYSCKSCGKKIYDMAIITGDMAYCSDCFKCKSCKKPIEDLRYARTSKGLFCMTCHNTLVEKKKRYVEERRLRGDSHHHNRQPRTGSSSSSNQHNRHNHQSHQRTQLTQASTASPASSRSPQNQNRNPHHHHNQQERQQLQQKQQQQQQHTHNDIYQNQEENSSNSTIVLDDEPTEGIPLTIPQNVIKSPAKNTNQTPALDSRRVSSASSSSDASGGEYYNIPMRSPERVPVATFEPNNNNITSLSTSKSNSRGGSARLESTSKFKDASTPNLDSNANDSFFSAGSTPYKSPHMKHNEQFKMSSSTHETYDNNKGSSSNNNNNHNYKSSAGGIPPSVSSANLNSSLGNLANVSKSNGSSSRLPPPSTSHPSSKLPAQPPANQNYLNQYQVNTPPNSNSKSNSSNNQESFINLDDSSSSSFSSENESMQPTLKDVNSIKPQFNDTVSATNSRHNTVTSLPKTKTLDPDIRGFDLSLQQVASPVKSPSKKPPTSNIPMTPPDSRTQLPLSGAGADLGLAITSGSGDNSGRSSNEEFLTGVSLLSQLENLSNDHGFDTKQQQTQQQKSSTGSGYQQLHYKDKAKLSLTATSGVNDPAKIISASSADNNNEGKESGEYQRRSAPFKFGSDTTNTTTPDSPEIPKPASMSQSSSFHGVVGPGKDKHEKKSSGSLGRSISRVFTRHKRNISNPTTYPNSSFSSTANYSTVPTSDTTSSTTAPTKPRGHSKTMSLESDRASILDSILHSPLNSHSHHYTSSVPSTSGTTAAHHQHTQSGSAIAPTGGHSTSHHHSLSEQSIGFVGGNAYTTPPLPKTPSFGLFHSRSRSDTVDDTPRKQQQLHQLNGNSISIKLSETERQLRLLRSEITTLSSAKANLLKDIQSLQTTKKSLELEVNEKQNKLIELDSALSAHTSSAALQRHTVSGLSSESLLVQPPAALGENNDEHRLRSSISSYGSTIGVGNSNTAAISVDVGPHTPQVGYNINNISFSNNGSSTTVNVIHTGSSGSNGSGRRVGSISGSAEDLNRDASIAVGPSSSNSATTITSGTDNDRNNKGRKGFFARKLFGSNNKQLQPQQQQQQPSSSSDQQRNVASNTSSNTSLSQSSSGMTSSASTSNIISMPMNPRQGDEALLSMQQPPQSGSLDEFSSNSNSNGNGLSSVIKSRSTNFLSMRTYNGNINNTSSSVPGSSSSNGRLFNTGGNSSYGISLYRTSIQERSTLECRKVPFVVTACLKEIECRGLSVEGIYRVSGAASNIDKLEGLFDNAEVSSLVPTASNPINVSNNSPIFNYIRVDEKGNGLVSYDNHLSIGKSNYFKEEDIHVVAGLLKRYLKKLPEPIIPYKEYSSYIATSTYSTNSSKIKHLKVVFRNLPNANLQTLFMLCNHLERVVSKEDYNKMNWSSISTIFSPTLCRDDSNDASKEITDLRKKSGTTEFLFRNYASVFDGLI